MLTNVSGRINSLEWNPTVMTQYSNKNWDALFEQGNIELVTAAQDCLVKFHDLTQPVKNEYDFPRPCNMGPKSLCKSNHLRTLVPVWKAR